MIITVFDTESDGLLNEATRLHCSVTHDNKGNISRIYGNDFTVLLRTLTQSDVIVAHNAIEHDLPLLDKLFNYKHRGIVLDTLVLSRLLNPERVGRHSIEAWGERFGIPKPVHEDWSVYTPAMLNRCEVDTKINYKLLYHLMEEADLEEKDLLELPKYE